jgi:hypothetical protein
VTYLPPPDVTCAMVCVGSGEPSLHFVAVARLKAPSHGGVGIRRGFLLVGSVFVCAVTWDLNAQPGVHMQLPHTPLNAFGSTSCRVPFPSLSLHFHRRTSSCCTRNWTRSTRMM